MDLHAQIDADYAFYFFLANLFYISMLTPSFFKVLSLSTLAINIDFLNRLSFKPFFSINFNFMAFIIANSDIEVHYHCC